MSRIEFRIAKPSDAKQIADCHWHVRDRYTQGIFLSLGKKFLETYYQIILNEPWEVVICAVNEKDNIIGFCSNTLNAESQAVSLKKHKVRLGLSALFSIIAKPRLIIDVWQRYKSLSGGADALKFVDTKGVRGEYWCWLKTSEEDLEGSTRMSNVSDAILYDLGVRETFFEVDKFNKPVYKYHLKVNKAEPIEEIILPDGRVRVMMRKELKR